MSFPLEQFEQFVNETILKRGLAYFEKDAVEEPELVDHGVYEAAVQGSMTYRVHLEIEKGNVTRQYCSCPYDHGPICKHVIAVLFYLQQDALDISPKPKKGKKKPRKKRKTLSEKVDGLLEELPKAELVKFVKTLTEQDPGLRRRFLANYAHLKEEESKALYAKQVSAILKSVPTDHGYISWHHTGQVGNAVYAMATKAKDHLDNGNPTTAFYMAFAILEEMTKSFNFMDDSNGDIGMNIDAAMEVLYVLSERKLEDDLRSEFYLLCLKDFGKGLFKGWNWHLDMLDLAARLALDSNESKQVLGYLDKEGFSRYESDLADAIKLRIIEKVDGEKAAEAYVMDNLDNPIFRRKAIEEYMAKKDYGKASEIAKAGVQKDNKNLPGLANEWRDWQLRIALKAGDSDAVIEYARNLIVGNANRDRMEYFRILKSHVPVKNWPDFLKKMIWDMDVNYYNDDIIAKFYVEEAWWEELFKLAKKSHGITLIQAYEQYLAKDYAPEIADIYDRQIRKFLSYNTGRKYYKQAVRQMRRIIKLGEVELADELESFLREKYGNRPALLEELDGI